MADFNSNDSATLTDDLEIDSYDDVVKLLGVMRPPPCSRMSSATVSTGRKS